jgi:hypothetical protein
MTGWAPKRRPRHAKGKAAYAGAEPRYSAPVRGPRDGGSRLPEREPQLGDAVPLEEAVRGPLAGSL